MKKNSLPPYKTSAWIIASLFIIASCQAPTDSKEKHSNKAKDNASVRKMLAAFEQQEHRLEFNRCEMLYNGTPFHIGMPIRELISIFGDYDYRNDFHYVWENVGIVVTCKSSAFGVTHEDTTSDINKPSYYMRVFLNETVSERNKEVTRHYSNNKKDYFLLEGMPVNRYMRAMDFFANSHFELGNFIIDNYGYELEYECDTYTLYYIFDVDNTWLTKDLGIGYFKDKPNPANENVFDGFYIVIRKKEAN